MEQATATPSTEVKPPETIEYGNLVWTKTDCETRFEYTSEQPECGSYYIYQYPFGDNSSCSGRWLWRVKFNTLLGAKPAILNMEVSEIVVGTDPEEAMQACLDAKDKFVEDIKLLAMQLGIGNYPTGYMDGQAALVDKIKMVLP